MELSEDSGLIYEVNYTKL